MWIFTWKVGSSPRQREGSPRKKGLHRRGHARLGEPKDSEDGLSSPPRGGVACLGEGRLSLG